MDINGLAFCSRYAYPPNSLSLCGPERRNDLLYYSAESFTDAGNREILVRFSTLYPYLKLISQENNIRDPFNPNVVEAYWLGNRMLERVKVKPFSGHLKDTLMLRKKISSKKLENILIKLLAGGLPNHAFHVINIYLRTGHPDIPYTLETMDACLINFGRVLKKGKNSLTVRTQKLITGNGALFFSPPILREINSQGKADKVFNRIKLGDMVSYHWGMVCTKLNLEQIKNLAYYNGLSLKLATLRDV